MFAQEETKWDKHGVRRVLPKDVELALEVLRVEHAAAGRRALAVVRAQHDEGLEDRGLLARCGGSEDGAVRRDLTPAEDAQAQLGGDFREERLLLLEADGVVGLEEDVPDGVLARFRKLATDLALSLALEEEVGDAGHYAGAVAIAAVCAGRATVGHGTEKLAGI